MHNNGSFKVPGLFGWLFSYLFGDKLKLKFCGKYLVQEISKSGSLTQSQMKMCLKNFKPVVVKGMCMEIRDHVRESDPSVCTWIQTQVVGSAASTFTLSHCTSLKIMFYYLQQNDSSLSGLSYHFLINTKLVLNSLCCIFQVFYRQVNLLKWAQRI